MYGDRCRKFGRSLCRRRLKITKKRGELVLSWWCWMLSDWISFRYIFVTATFVF